MATAFRQTESIDIDVEGCYDEGIEQFSPDGSLDTDRPRLRAGMKRSPNERDDMQLRKKLRNRESAQRARDRQKAKMRWLEDELQRIKTKNDQLLRENLILRHMCSDNQKLPQQQPINSLTSIQPNAGLPGMTSPRQQLLSRQTAPTPLHNLPKTATPQTAFANLQQADINLQQAHLIQSQNQQKATIAQQQQRLFQMQRQRLIQQQITNAQPVQANLTKQIQTPVIPGSHDSDNSVPSVLSTGSNNGISPHLNQCGDELLKAAVRVPAIGQEQQQPNLQILQQSTAAQQYAAALAAIAQQQQTLNQSLLAHQQQAQITTQPTSTVPVGVIEAEPVQKLEKIEVKQENRPSSVGCSNPSNCNTSDDDKL